MSYKPNERKAVTWFLLSEDRKLLLAPYPMVRSKDPQGDITELHIKNITQMWRERGKNE